jgi:hypothetical protein
MESGRREVEREGRGRSGGKRRAGERHDAGMAVSQHNSSPGSHNVAFGTAGRTIGLCVPSSSLLLKSRKK